MKKLAKTKKITASVMMSQELDERIIRAVSEMGFEHMSPIQAAAIPVMLKGKAMISDRLRHRYTGKTAVRSESLFFLMLTLTISAFRSSNPLPYKRACYAGCR